MGKAVFPLVSDHFTIRPVNENDIWNEKWTVCLKDGNKDEIGTLSFEGGMVAGEIPLSIELKPEYRDKGYGTELFRFMARYAFRYRFIREVKAVCSMDNELCVRALEKADYVFRERVGRTYYYSIKKEKPVWTGVYLVVGLIAGMIIGIVFSNLWAGTVFGVVVGLIMGFLLDKRDDPDNTAPGAK